MDQQPSQLMKEKLLSKNSTVGLVLWILTIINLLPLIDFLFSSSRYPFAAVIFPSLLQLQKGLTDVEDKRQKVVCMERYRRRDDDEIIHFSEIDAEREEECGICMEMNRKIVLPDCSHSMCMKCYRDW